MSSIDELSVSASGLDAVADELARAASLRLSIVTIVANDTERSIVSVARDRGVSAFEATDMRSAALALERALATRVPTVIEVRTLRSAA